jgi:NADH:ubiquinone oxidoreductase subunit K
MITPIPIGPGLRQMQILGNIFTLLIIPLPSLLAALQVSVGTAIALWVFAEQSRINDDLSYFIVVKIRPLHNPY